MTISNLGFGVAVLGFGGLGFFVFEDLGFRGLAVSGSGV